MAVFTLIFFICIHCVSCIWIFVAGMQDSTYKGTWIADKNAENFPQSDLYWISFYWTITTVTTVGYGDITGTNTAERIFCAVIMVVGVIAFSFVNGALASIISDSD